MIGAGKLERVEGYTWSGGPCCEDFCGGPSLLSIPSQVFGLGWNLFQDGARCRPDDDLSRLRCPCSDKCLSSSGARERATFQILETRGKCQGKPRVGAHGSQDIGNASGNHAHMARMNLSVWHLPKASCQTGQDGCVLRCHWTMFRDFIRYCIWKILSSADLQDVLCSRILWQ